MNKEIPNELQEYLGKYGEQVYDSCCGKCIGWGYPIVKHCGGKIWSELSKYGDQECLHGNNSWSWYLSN